jgi:hypothetical protein
MRGGKLSVEFVAAGGMSEGCRPVTIRDPGVLSEGYCPVTIRDPGASAGESGFFLIGDGGEMGESAMAIGLVSSGQESTLSRPVFSGGKIPRLIASLTNS